MAPLYLPDPNTYRIGAGNGPRRQPVKTEVGLAVSLGLSTRQSCLPTGTRMLVTQGTPSINYTSCHLWLIVMKCQLKHTPWEPKAPALNFYGNDSCKDYGMGPSVLSPPEHVQKEYKTFMFLSPQLKLRSRVFMTALKQFNFL